MNPTSNEPLAIGGMTDESVLHSIYRRSGLRASLGDRGGGPKDFAMKAVRPFSVFGPIKIAGLAASDGRPANWRKPGPGSDSGISRGRLPVGRSGRRNDRRSSRRRARGPIVWKLSIASMRFGISTILFGCDANPGPPTAGNGNDGPCRGWKRPRFGTCDPTLSLKKSKPPRLVGGGFAVLDPGHLMPIQ